ncbi:hypothetical protein V2G26_007001 [Clonostachys chloroleuca]
MDQQTLERVLGGLFLVGFNGTVLTDELRELIAGHFVGAVLLTAKNLESANQATQLVQSLQQCAHDAGHERPLLIAIDQEHGSLDSLMDDSITQFPSAMGTAATASASPGLTRQAALATATELRSVGVNWIIGPVLDVLSASRPSPLGVRAFGDDPITVLTHGVETLRGFKEAGVACCGKHFPSYGDAEFADGTEFSLPSIDTTMEELRSRAFIPFRACAQVGLDAILVGGCTLNIAGKTTDYACVDRHVVSGMLRGECQFEGVIISECMAMEALFHEVGISQGTIRAVTAGCDVVVICSSYRAQLEGIDALKIAVQDSSIPLDILLASSAKVNAMKDRCTSWEQALNPPGAGRLADLHKEHLPLSDQLYQGAISLVRDSADNLGRIRKLMSSNKEVVLLSPLIDLFPSTATRKGALHTSSALGPSQLAPGEDSFQAFGALLAKQLQVRLTHTSYSSNGLRRQHEELISRASAVIILTADAVRNAYQYGVTKHANMQCKYQKGEDGLDKPLVVIALSSPHDFLNNGDVQTYLCTYDFTPPSLHNLARLLAGSLSTTSKPPLALARRTDVSSETSPAVRHPQTTLTWLVEQYDDARDRVALGKLLRNVLTKPQYSRFLPIVSNVLGHSPQPACFVVRNSSTGVIFGAAVASAKAARPQNPVSQDNCLFVDPERRGIGIEESLRGHIARHQTLRTLQNI